ncbi:hypothetical protein L1987_13967 [Smallanthus sonchifolius]|uniref:Uncharacterized protein n=1 Tax=Smallanthus sonchifolius TaxID=185202 RepID=A0ACB9JIF1_9ASTR|nr:hypothetical protein L1987_13967 [Smallanthus sonchifolius]
MTSTTLQRPSRRSPSFSSSSSSSVGSLSFFLDDSSSPATPLRYSGIPFSWEQFPGIPKKNNTNEASSQCHLPLPPSGVNSFRKSFGKDSAPVIKKYSTGDRSFHEDPFFAAFVECSKDDEMAMKGSKIRSGTGGGFGGLYTSCFRACEVAESVVYVPRSCSGDVFR